jgi:hypothetical protein
MANRKRRQRDRRGRKQEHAPPAQVKGAVASTHRRVPLSADLIGDISM